MSLFQMSVSGAAMILTVIVIRALAINHLPKKTFIALWGIVLLRLFVPFSLPSPFSAYSLFDNYIHVTQRTAGLGDANMFPAMPAGLPAMAADVLQGRTATSISWYVIVWGIGMIVCALFFTVSYLKCRREFRESLPVNNDFLTQWIAEHKLSRLIEIRQSSRISAPLTWQCMFYPIGIFNFHVMKPWYTPLVTPQSQLTLVHSSAWRKRKAV